MKLAKTQSLNTSYDINNKKNGRNKTIQEKKDMV
jgi:hypothetical protein